MFREREQLSNHEHHHHENECCAREAAPTEIALNASAAGNLQTTLQVAGVDCAEEVSLIQRALKPLGGVREVRVNIMSGKAIIAHDETITPEVLIKAIGDAGLKAIREGEKTGDQSQQRQKERLLSVSISGAFTLLGRVCFARSSVKREGSSRYASKSLNWRLPVTQISPERRRFFNSVSAHSS